MFSGKPGLLGFSEKKQGVGHYGAVYSPEEQIVPEQRKCKVGMKSYYYYLPQLFQTGIIFVYRPLSLASWNGKIEQHFAAFLW